jgi:hypothetical protein
MAKRITLTTIVEMIENLAASTARGFAEMEKRFVAINERFDRMDERFDRIENITLRNHENRIEKLEDHTIVIKTKLGLQ